MLKIAVLASTNATDMQALIDEIEAGKLDAEISVLITDRPCGAIKKAEDHNIKFFEFDSKNKDREAFDREMEEVLEYEGVDIIILIGYMRYLSKWFVGIHRNQIMNIHPSLLPAFAGGMDENVHQKVLDSGVTKTGATLHFVDEGKDTGPIILQKEVAIKKGETVASLKHKVQKAEQEILVRAVKLYSEERITVDGHKVIINE